MDAGFNIAGLRSSPAEPHLFSGSIHPPFRAIQLAVNAADESSNSGETNIVINPGRYFDNVAVNIDEVVRRNIYVEW